MIGTAKLNRRVATLYEEYVVAPNLERTTLLRELRARFSGSPVVLYPGSFVHLTLSFFFQNVTYVDRSDFARGFFAQAASVASLAGAQRAYSQQPYIRFPREDFTQAIPVPGCSVGLLLALYVGGVSSSSLSKGEGKGRG